MNYNSSSLPEQILRGLEVAKDIAVLAGLALLAIKAWPVIAAVLHALNSLANTLGS